MRLPRAAGLLLLATCAACDGEKKRDGDSSPTPTQTPTATPTPTPVVAVDRWSPLLTFDDGDAGDRSYGSPTHMSLLPDGRIVAFAQFMRTPWDETTTKYFRSFLLTPPPDPATGVAVPVSVPTSEDARNASDILFCSGHALMDDGNLFQAGGTRQSPYSGTNYSRIRNSTTDTWADVPGDMQGQRWYPTVTRLPPSGPGVASPMLITAGYANVAFNPTRSVEVYEPGTGYRVLATGAPTGILGDAESDYTHVHLLPNPSSGVEALMIGGGGDVYGFQYSNPVLDSSLRFQPVTQRGAVMAGATSVLLPLRNESTERGRLLIMGGSEDDDVLRRIDLYDVAAGTWQAVPTTIARHHASSVLLPDGTVLFLAGHGFPETFPLALDANRPTIFDPATLQFRDGPDSGDDTVRGYHNAALLLPDGRVLLGSGRTYALPGHSERNDGRYYYPAYLDPALASAKPEILAAAATMTYDVDYAIDYDDENGPVQRVVLMALGASTHSIDFNQRAVVLFSGESAASLSVRTPLDPTIAPPGHYMLFVMRRVDGTLVPSTASIVRLTF